VAQLAMLNLPLLLLVNGKSLIQKIALFFLELLLVLKLPWCQRPSLNYT
jgi:hypothetical protein